MLLFDLFYNNIINCMQSAVNDAIPHSSNKNGNSEYNIPGWNDFVADKHDLARVAFKEWVIHGKPKNNFIFENMKKQGLSSNLRFGIARITLNRLKLTNVPRTCIMVIR